ncbi:MAG: protein kinase [Prevotella sp.]|nr:protein kinase [Prevotella sp.]
MLNEGSVFADRYKLIRQLGRGGFSEVWLAEDSMTNVQVAVKIYAPGTGLDEDGIKIFTQEFACVFDMNHTNLLRPTHYDCWERMPYLIMPLIKNGSAFKYIVNGEKMPEEECWKLLHDVAAGLAYLHEKTPPLIHQDIKPDNILIDDEGRYLITDFGISARVRSTIRKGSQSVEQSGGTLAYMGPERFSSTPKPIMASDIWSLGAMMYELMTGLPPFGNMGGGMQKNGADIPIIDGDYSEDLKNIVYATLAKEPWDRPSAHKIEELAYNYLHGIPMSDIHMSNPNFTQTVSPNINNSMGAGINNSMGAGVNNSMGAGIYNSMGEGVNNSMGAGINNSMGDGVNNSMGGFQQSNQAFIQNSPASPAPNKKGSKGKIFAIAGIAAIILIGILIALFNGDDKESMPTPVVATTPTINYDSLALVHIIAGDQLLNEANQFLKDHEEDGPYDEAFGKVEETYANALSKFTQALENKDSLSADITTRATEASKNAKNALLKIYNDFIETAAALGESEAASKFKERAEGIKPLIENMIKTEDNNQLNDNSNEE